MLCKWKKMTLFAIYSYITTSIKDWSIWRHNYHRPMFGLWEIGYVATHINSISHCFKSTQNRSSDLHNARPALCKFSNRARSHILEPMANRPCHLIVVPLLRSGRRHITLGGTTIPPISANQLRCSSWKHDADWPSSVFTWRLSQRTIS